MGFYCCIVLLIGLPIVLPIVLLLPFAPYWPHVGSLRGAWGGGVGVQVPGFPGPIWSLDPGIIFRILFVALQTWDYFPRSRTGMIFRIPKLGLFSALQTWDYFPHIYIYIYRRLGG